MSETNEVECMLCGKQAPNLDMCVAACPTLGHHLDFAMACKWFCPDPCFKRYRSNPHIRDRVHRYQDAAAEWARASIESCSDEMLSEMEHLPEGLRVTSEERTRLAELRDKLDRVEDLQSDEDNHLIHRVCRNINKTPWQHPETANFIDYDTVKENFEKLERLNPEERRRLN